MTDARYEAQRLIVHLAGQVLVLLGGARTELMEILGLLLIKDLQVIVKLVVVSLGNEAELLGDRAATKYKAVVFLELLDLANDGEHDELVEALQERRAQMLMQDMDVAQAEDLRALGIVPARNAIQVHALADAIGNVAQQSTEECEVVRVHGNERRHVILILSVEVDVVLARHQGSRLLVDREVDNTLQFILPNLLALYVQEVLDVLDGALEACELLAKHLEFGLERLLALGEDEALMQELRQCPTKLLADAVDENLFGVNLDDTHERLVKHEHAFSEHRDLMRSLR